MQTFHKENIMNTSFIVPENIITEIHNHTFHANQLLQNEYLWQLSYSKSLRSRNLIKYFSDLNIKYLKTKVFIVGKTLANTHIELNDEYSERRLNSTDIANPSYDLIQDLGGSIVFITSGETDSIDKRNSFASIFEKCPNTIFIGWDTDNHHALYSSLFLAAYTDIYCPTHLDNLYAISRFNNKFRPVYSGSIMWTRRYIQDNVGKIYGSHRKSTPHGLHRMYSIFPFRNNVVVTLNKFYDSIGFQDSDLSIHETADDYFSTLCTHKLHWVIPTLNDLSIRVFDILTTGGIPLVPEALRHDPALFGLDDADIIFYDANDIIDPKIIVDHGLKLFDMNGQLGIARRFIFGLNSHSDRRLTQSLGFAKREFFKSID